MYLVIDRNTGKKLTAKQILAEVNRDRSDDWKDFDNKDLQGSSSDVLEWLNPEFFEITYC